MTEMALAPGARAPDFTLRQTPEHLASLRELAGRPVVLAFYPADWNPVSGDQMSLYQAALAEFQSFHAQMVGISVDGVWSHLAFARERGIEFPLLSDFEPKGGVARAYGVYRRGDGFSERALFVIDPQGTIAWSYVSPLTVNPGAEGILRALMALEAGLAPSGVSL